MPARVTLTITEGKLAGRRFVFDERTTCIIGRAKDCEPRVPNDADHRQISRHHCLLDINPPDVRVRDFGSLNGTYVNGQKIGQRQKEQSLDDVARERFPEVDLKDGDEIRLACTVFRMNIETPLVCQLLFGRDPRGAAAGRSRRQTGLALRSLSPEGRGDSRAHLAPEDPPRSPQVLREVRP
ncbi:MAG: FHA domain-containing protein [Bryobacterales bacterium]|nr:FHA domain-containing protein [Bryobacterales bacterium]